MSNLLETAIQAAVPLHIMELELKGGPSPQDVQEATEMSSVLGEKGDRLLFRTTEPGETTELFNRTAKAVAVLAFCPGGVEIFGQRFIGNATKAGRK